MHICHARVLRSRTEHNIVWLPYMTNEVSLDDIPSVGLYAGTPPGPKARLKASGWLLAVSTTWGVHVWRLQTTHEDPHSRYSFFSVFSWIASALSAMLPTLTMWSIIDHLLVFLCSDLCSLTCFQLMWDELLLNFQRAHLHSKGTKKTVPKAHILTVYHICSIPSSYAARHFMTLQSAQQLEPLDCEHTCRTASLSRCLCSFILVQDRTTGYGLVVTWIVLDLLFYEYMLCDTSLVRVYLGEMCDANRQFASAVFRSYPLNATTLEGFSKYILDLREL